MRGEGSCCRRLRGARRRRPVSKRDRGRLVPPLGLARLGTDETGPAGKKMTDDTRLLEAHGRLANRMQRIEEARPAEMNDDLPYFIAIFVIVTVGVFLLFRAAGFH